MKLKKLCMYIFFHAISRTQQGWQRKPCVQTLRSLASTTPLPRHHSIASTPERKFKIFYFLEWELNLQPIAISLTRLCICAMTGLKKFKNQFNFFAPSFKTLRSFLSISEISPVEY